MGLNDVSAGVNITIDQASLQAAMIELFITIAALMVLYFVLRKFFA